ncbi:uncharacterized protein LOC103032975 [Astyanax mexicanus]|uniref:uncharacterized protein LOC103032975 n=1 Tax=Astyanax mexicanus TaxID=7994 RepID=UPI000BBDE544|nr:uncharacterized protein LOC103032975 [Astyanax mexicanus]
MDLEGLRHVLQSLVRHQDFLIAEQHASSIFHYSPPLQCRVAYTGSPRSSHIPQSQVFRHYILPGHHFLFLQYNYKMLRLTFEALFTLVVETALLIKVVLLKRYGDFIRVLIFGSFKEESTVIMSTENEGLAHCKLILLFAVLMDLLGITAVLVGVFAPLEVKGRDFGDLLVYSGVLLVLISMGGWVMWYSGNIEGLTSATELGYKPGAIDRLARTLSQRIRKSRRRSHATP